MPYPNEHASRQNDPGKYAKIRRVNNKFGEGIHAVFGVTDAGKTEVQAIRFDKTKFTPGEAKVWLEKNKYSTTLAKATDEKADGGAGSGNFGHSGREGERGGSATGTGGKAVPLMQAPTTREQESTIGQVLLKENASPAAATCHIDDKTGVATVTIRDKNHPSYTFQVAKDGEYAGATKAAHEAKMKAEREVNAAVYRNAFARGELAPDYAAVQRLRGSMVSRRQEIINRKRDSIDRFDGGAGSGNFGHAGREGERGGSVSGGLIFAEQTLTKQKSKAVIFNL